MLKGLDCLTLGWVIALSLSPLILDTDIGSLASISACMSCSNLAGSHVSAMMMETNEMVNLS